MFVAKVYTQRAQARLGRALKKIDAASQATVRDLLQVGMERARTLVPKGQTGWLYRSIKPEFKLTQHGAHAQIKLEPYILDDGHPRNVANFSLARWSHTSAKADRHFKTGDPKFMYHTRDYLNSIKNSVATGRFKSINIGE